MTKPAHVTIVTLGVEDLVAATAFYQRLGFVKSESASQATISFFKAGAVVLSLYPRDAVAEDIGIESTGISPGSVTLAQNLESEADVDAFMAHAVGVGAKLLKPAQKAFWGGYSGYFADPDGHVWEVAFNPFLPLREDGSPVLAD